MARWSVGGMSVHDIVYLLPRTKELGRKSPATAWNSAPGARTGHVSAFTYMPSAGPVGAPMRAIGVIGRKHPNLSHENALPCRSNDVYGTPRPGFSGVQEVDVSDGRAGTILSRGIRWH